MTTKDSLLDFPCEFPIKVMGKSSLAFEAAIVAIFRKHIPYLSEGAVTTKPSNNGNYISITITFIAESQEQIDAIYEELTVHPDVLMAL